MFISSALPPVAVYQLFLYPEILPWDPSSLHLSGPFHRSMYFPLSPALFFHMRLFQYSTPLKLICLPVVLVMMISGMIPGDDSLECPNCFCTSISVLFEWTCFFLKYHLFLPSKLTIWRTWATDERRGKVNPSLNLFPGAYLLLHTWAFGARVAPSTMTAVCLGSRERWVEAGRLGREAWRMALVCP